MLTPDEFNALPFAQQQRMNHLAGTYGVSPLSLNPADFEDTPAPPTDDLTRLHAAHQANIEAKRRAALTTPVEIPTMPDDRELAQFAERYGLTIEAARQSWQSRIDQATKAEAERQQAERLEQTAVQRAAEAVRLKQAKATGSITELVDLGNKALEDTTRNEARAAALAVLPSLDLWKE